MAKASFLTVQTLEEVGEGEIGLEIVRSHFNRRLVGPACFSEVELQCEQMAFEHIISRHLLGRVFQLCPSLLEFGFVQDLQGLVQPSIEKQSKCLLMHR